MFSAHCLPWRKITLSFLRPAVMRRIRTFLVLKTEDVAEMSQAGRKMLKEARFNCPHPFIPFTLPEGFPQCLLSILKDRSVNPHIILRHHVQWDHLLHSGSLLLLWVPPACWCRPDQQMFGYGFGPDQTSRQQMFRYSFAPSCQYFTCQAKAYGKYIGKATMTLRNIISGLF